MKFPLEKTNRAGATLAACAAFCVLSAAGCFWGPGRTPEGQQPLFTLSESNFSEFVSAFDAASDGPRLVVLPSPT